MGNHQAILLPLLSGLTYAVSAIMLKRATQNGVGPWRISFVTNWIQALIFAPYWLFGGAPFAPVHLFHALLAGFTFFIGQVFTFLALSRGDVSVATPVLGTKVIFVAFFTVLLAGQKLGASLWMAALLTTIATALLGGGPGQRAQSIVLSLTYGFSAAAAFALTDVLVQMWAPLWGFGHFAPTMFLAVALYSFGLIPLFHEPLRALPATAWRWVLPGGTLLALQATGIAYTIVTFGDATSANVIYNTRAVWSVLLVWTVGHWFDNTERDQGHKVMARRLFGSLLLISAILLTVFS